jgi:hypothetical protein
MEATMTFDTGWHVNPLAGWRAYWQNHACYGILLSMVFMHNLI